MGHKSDENVLSHCTQKLYSNPKIYGYGWEKKPEMEEVLQTRIRKMTYKPCTIKINRLLKATEQHSCL